MIPVAKRQIASVLRHIADKLDPRPKRATMPPYATTIVSNGTTSTATIGVTRCNGVDVNDLTIGDWRP